MRIAFRCDGEAFVGVVGRAGESFLLAADVAACGVKLSVTCFEEDVEAGIIRVEGGYACAVFGGGSGILLSVYVVDSCKRTDTYPNVMHPRITRGFPVPVMRGMVATTCTL